jgi:S-DNA-T family DNA segregation ATPase FtsK/SpoIIIE
MLTESQTKIVAQIALKLQGLKIKAQFKHAHAGPIITTYYWQLGFDEPIAKIINKSEDIAIACGVDAVLIRRAMNEIAIEVPNTERSIIRFDECLFNLMTQGKFRSMELPILLGVDPYGTTKCLNLVEQPHILIAGSTGGGKSILLSSIIGALAVSKSEREVRLILVDTKRLDLPLFERLPHVFKSIEEVENFQVALTNLMSLVRNRTETMKGIARNSTEWNQLGHTPFMPYYVVIIDELADLIAQDEGKRLVDLEYDEKYSKIPSRIAALVNICRASGVHIIAATQRASAKVINGEIKNNMPTRIALRVPSRIDSTTIIGDRGAENLLGKGDMLVDSLGSSIPQRYHGAFVSNSDIAKILIDASMIREQLLSLPEVVS